MSRLLWLVSVWSIVFYLVRDSYLGELAGSFLPYLVVGWIVVALVSLIVALASKRRWTKIVSGMSFAILIGMSVWWGQKIYDFYDVERVGVVGGWFSMLYDNIYVYNHRYDILKKTIKKADPDVLVLVEFARHHRANMGDFLTSIWLKYTNRINRETIYDSNLFASYYPVDEVITYQWLDNYINMESQKMAIGDRKVMFHVVHAISPISPRHFFARNQQLLSLVDIMNQATKNHPDHIHILIGDFNTSPWSVHYERLQAGLGDVWVNHTRQIPLLMTWKISWASWIQSHIDHVWVRWWGDVSVSSSWLDGSDHKILEMQIQ